MASYGSHNATGDSGLWTFRSSRKKLGSPSNSRDPPTSPNPTVSPPPTATSSSRSMQTATSPQSHRRSFSAAESSASSSYTEASTKPSARSHPSSSARATPNGRSRPRPPSPPSMYAAFDLGPVKKARPNPYLKTKSQSIAQTHKKGPSEPMPPLLNISFKAPKLSLKLRRTLSPRSSATNVAKSDGATGSGKTRDRSATLDSAVSQATSDSGSYLAPAPPPKFHSKYPEAILEIESPTTPSPLHSAPSSYASTSTSASISIAPRTPSPQRTNHWDKVARTLGEPDITDLTPVKSRRASSVPTVSTITQFIRTETNEEYDSDLEHSPIVFSPPTPGLHPTRIQTSEPPPEVPRIPTLYFPEEEIPSRPLSAMSVVDGKVTQFDDPEPDSDGGRDNFDVHHGISREISRRPVTRSQSFIPIRTLPTPPSSDPGHSAVLIATTVSSSPLDNAPVRALPLPGKQQRPSGARPSTSSGVVTQGFIQDEPVSRPSTSHKPSSYVPYSTTTLPRPKVSPTPAPSHSSYTPYSTWHNHAPSVSVVPAVALAPPPDAPFMSEALEGSALLSPGSTIWKGDAKRSEKSQGWSGEWNRDDMQDVIQRLRELK